MVFLFTFFSAQISFAQQDSDSTNYFSPNNRLKFGSYLYKDKDYLRAAEEFKEYLKFSYDDTVQFKLANSFLKIGRYTEASDNFKTLFLGSSLSEESRLMFFESNFFLNDYNFFRTLTEKEIYLTEKYSREVDRLNSITYLFDNAKLPDENLLLKPFSDSAKSQISAFFLEKKFPKYRSVTTAVLLSTVIPGAGKIYTGEIGDGITAFVATALSVYLSYNNFKNDHQFRGWLFAGLTAFFYGGNIYGSAASAQIYSARIRFNFESEVKLYFEQRNYFLPRIDY